MKTTMRKTGRAYFCVTVLLAVAALCSPFAPPACGVPIRILDDLGVETLLDAPAKRVVSLYAGHTENLIAIGAREALVAASQADDRDVVAALPRLGAKPGVEQIVALKPDLVLTRPMMARAQSDLYERLRALGVKVVAIDPPAWEEFPAYIGLLAEATVGDPARWREEARLATVSADGGDRELPGVLLITNGKTMATCAPDSWAAHVLAAAGCRNAAPNARPVSGGSAIAAFGAERMLVADAAIDVVLLQQGAMNALRAADVLSDPRFASMRAVRAGRVFDIPEEDISRPSLLRLRMGVVRELAEIVQGKKDGVAAIGGKSP